jgi:CubicO group peptidase (beta-lactamase class C family)
MSHQAGLNGLSVPMDEAGLLASTPCLEALAAMAPLWEPGSRCIYHALTYGHLAGEPLRHVVGRSLGHFIAEEIAGLLGADFFIGR